MASDVGDSIQTNTPEATQLRLAPRLAGLVAVFAAELLLISARTPHLALRDTPGLPGLVFALGPWKVRLLVTFAVVSLLFWQARGKGNLGGIPAQAPHRLLSWQWLAAHLIAILSFARLTSLLFENRMAGFPADLLVVGWALTGVAGLTFGGFAFLPIRIWKALLRGTGDVWAYIVVLATGASVFAIFAAPLWLPLARWTLVLAFWMLHPFLPSAAVDAATRSFGTPGFTVEVAPECSGYEGIGLILAFTTGWLWFFRKEWRFPRALLLIPLGVAAIWVFNALRVALLVFIGAEGAPDIALQGFHSHAGWIAFNLVALGTCVAARSMPWLTRDGVAAVPMERSGTNPTAAYLLPFLAILAAGMVAGAVSNGFEWLYALRVVAAAAALWYFRDRYRNMQWQVGWSSLALGGLVFLIWIGLESILGHTHSGEPSALAAAPPVARIGWLALRVFGAVITVPIAEELAFRGFLLRRLVSADFESVAWRTFAWAPFLISSIAFGILHGERWLAGTLAGMIYAVAMQRRGRIGEAAAAHAVTNASLAAYVLATGNWQLW